MEKLGKYVMINCVKNYFDQARRFFKARDGNHLEYLKYRGTELFILPQRHVSVHHKEDHMVLVIYVKAFRTLVWFEDNFSMITATPNLGVIQLLIYYVTYKGYRKKIEGKNDIL